MITCTLSDKQLSILRTKIARDLLTYIGNKTPFNLKEYLLKMYNDVKGITNNENSAIDYARLTAPFIKQLLGVDATYDDVRDLGLDIVELYDLTKNISDEKKGINNLIEYLDLNSNVSEKLKNVKEELQKEENQKSSETKNTVRISNTVYGVTGKPATPISTTIQELYEGKQALGKDPRMAVYTAVTKKILNKLFNSNTLNEGADVTGEVVPLAFEGVEGGLVLSLTRYNRLSVDDVYPYVKEALDSGADKDYAITNYKNDYIYILTDVNGNPVRFNDDAEVDAQGRIIYFNSRYLPSRLDNDQFDIDNVTNVRTPVELSQNLGISVDDAREQLRAEFEQLEKAYRYIDAKPGNTVIYNITGGSYGSQDTGSIEPVSFRPDIFKSETPVFAYLKANQAQDGANAGVYIQNPITKAYYLAPSSKLAGKAEELAKFLTEDVVHPDGDLVTGKEKVAVLSTYVLNSIKDIHYKVNPDTDNIEISLSGQKLNLSLNSDKVRLQEALAKVPAGYDRTYVVNTTKANKNSAVSIFSLSGNTAEISTVPYQTYLETFLKIRINLDTDGNPVTYNPYFTLSLANMSSAKVLLAPENIDQQPKIVSTTSAEPIDEFAIADSLPSIEQNFKDGSGGRKMQSQFADKSTMDLILSGDRTRTTRAKTDIGRMVKDYNLSKIEDLVGKVIRMTDKTGRQVYTRITKVTPFTQEYQDATWQKEGWVKEVTDKHVGNYPYAIEFELVNKPATQGNEASSVKGVPQVIEKAEKATFARRRSSSADSNILDNLKNDDFINKFKNKLKNQGNVAATKEQIRLAKIWYENSPLAKHIPLKVLFNMINTRTPNGVARWDVNGITLFKGSDFSDLYHEAWHGFTQMFLTKADKERLYAEAAKQAGEFRTFNGEVKKFSEATEEELEEYLAEDFREFMLGKGKKVLDKTPIKKNIFQRIFDFLMALFGKSTTNDIVYNGDNNPYIQELYEKLRVGDIVEYTFDQKNRVFTTLNKTIEAIPGIEEDIQKLSYEDSKLIGQSINSLFSKGIDLLNGSSTNVFTIAAIRTLEGRSTLYKYVLQTFKDMLENALLDRADMVEQGFDTQDIDYEIQTLTYAVKHFGDPDNLVNPTGVIKYHMETSKFFELEDREVQVQREALDRVDDSNVYLKNQFESKAGNESSAKSLASSNLLYTIKSLYAYDSEGNVRTNRLGLPLEADYNASWNRLFNITDGSTDVIDIYNRLSEASKDYPMVKQFLKKVGHPSTMERVSQDLWTDIQNVFTMPRIPLVVLRMEHDVREVVVSDAIVDEQTNEIVQEEETAMQEFLTIRPSKAGGEYNKVGNKWDSFFTSAEPGKYIYTDSNNINVLNVEAVLADFSKFPNNNTKDGVEKVFKLMEAIGMPLEYTSATRKAMSSSRNPIFKAVYDTYLVLKAIQTYNKVHAGNDPIIITKPSEIFKDRGIRTDDKNLNNKFSGYRSRFETIQKFQLTWSDDFSDTTVSNATGETQYEKTLPSTLSNEVSKLNNADTIEDLTQEGMENPTDLSMNHLAKSRNPFSQNLMILNRLFDENGKKRVYISSFKDVYESKLELLNGSGSSVALSRVGELINESGIESANADETTKYLQDFYMLLLYGTAEATRHADKATTYLIRLMAYNENGKRLKHFFDMSSFASKADPMGPSLGRINFINNIVKYVSSEYERIQKLLDGDEAGNTLIGNKTYKEVGSKFVIFENVIKDAELKELEKFRDASVKTASDFIKYLNADKNSDLKNRIEIQIGEYLDTLKGEFRKTLSKMNFFNNKTLLNTALSTVASRVVIERATEAKIEEYTEALLEGYVANDWTNKFEITTLFYGDVGLIKNLDDFFKRNAGIGSTGTIPRTDKYMVDYINDRLNKFSYAKTLKLPTKSFGKTMTSAVLEDKISKSVYLKEYIAEAKKEAKKFIESLSISKADKTKRLKDAYAKIEARFNKTYGEMTEADGQGWITFDAYRALLMSMRKWSPEQEKLFVKISNGEKVDINDTLMFFPVKKMQYWGPLLTKGLPIRAFHKFSLMPLIPNIIGDENLGILHKKMIEQKIDYSLMLSGSKLNTLTKDGKADKFYNDSESAEDRSVAFADANYKFTPNEIFLDNFKDQVEVHDHYDGKITFSTQLRKLIENGLMANGVPTDWRTDITDDEERYNEWESATTEDKLKSKNYNKILRYEALLAKLVELKKNQLSKRIGKDKKKLVEFIKKNLSERELSDNELDFIDYNGIDDDFKNDLDLSLSASDIEKLLIGIVQKKLINQRVTGEALVQVSGVGFEKSDAKLRKATKKESKLYGGTNGLSTYHMDNGKVRVSKVKISLQGNFKKLVYLESVVNKANEEGIDRLDALNALLKDKNWLDKAVDPKKEIYTKAFASLDNDKGDRKLFILRSDLTPEIEAQLTPNTKDGKRVKGEEYYGIKILGDYYSHNTLKSKDGGNLDVIVVDKVEDAEAQYQAYLKGGAKNFTGISDIVKPDTNRDLVRMVAVRIPVQGLNSMEVMEVYEFLPESSGNIVILPAEIVAKSGGDFDIDKMFTLMPNISAKLTSTQMKDVLAAMSEQLGRTITEEEIENIQNKYKDVDAEEPFTEEDEDVLNLFDYLVDQSTDVITIKLDKNEDTVKGVENALLREMADILTMPENFISLITPNGIDILADLATDMAEKVRKVSKTKQPLSKIFELGQNMYKHQSNSIGKAVLGIIAVANTFNTLFARTGLVMSNSRVLTYDSDGGPVFMNQKLYLNHNTINGNISLSSMYDKELGNKVADVINQMINGAVDVAKDAWIFDIQGNKEVIPSLLFMIQAGVPIKDAVYFVSQPIIRDYINKVKLYKSQFAVPLGQPDTGMFFRLEARNRILFDIANGFTKEPANYINPLTNRYDKRLVFDLLGEFAPSVKSVTTDDLYKNLQRSEGEGYTDVDRAVFAHFLQIQEMSGQITQLTQGLKFDNDRTVTMSDARLKLDKIAELSNGISDESIRRIVEESPISAFKIQDFIIEKFGGIFKLKDGEAVNNIIDRIFERQADNTSIYARYKKNTKMDEEEFRLKYRENILTYLFQKDFYTFDINTKSYQNQNVEFAVEEVSSLTAGVGVKNGVLYVNKKDIKENFTNKDYLKKWSYGAPLSASILSMYDDTTALEMFTKFLYERETLRTFDSNSLSNIENSSEYKFYYNEFAKEKDEKIRSYKAYESVLRDKALTNIGLHGHLFYGPMAYGRQLMRLSEAYPDLFKKYPLLDNLSAITVKAGLDTFTNVKFSNTLLTKDDYNEYVVNFNELSNPSVKKVEDDVENEKISKLFQMLPLFAILQSGSDTKSTYSLIRAIPFESYLPLISKPYKDFINSSLDEQSSVLADYTLQFVKNQYNKSNKFKNKLKNWANSTVKNLELTKDTRDRIINLDPSMVPPDPFSSETLEDDVDQSRLVKLTTPDGAVVNINLNSLKIGFTPNQEQLSALQQMVDFIESDTEDKKSLDRMFSLMGYAGTGKTSITKILLQYLKMRRIRTGLTATTHKAKVVLGKATEAKTDTLHKLLGLRPSPKPLEELDLSELNFLRTGAKEADTNDIIIIDEASFISDELFDFITAELKNKKDLKVIFIGDPAQIKPVKQTTTSKVFTDLTNSVELKTVERQAEDNPLGPILDAIRNNIKSPKRAFSTDSAINGNEGIGFVESKNDFLKAAAQAFKSDNFAANRNFARIITYSNDDVSEYNKAIRKALGLTGEFREGEILMSYKNARYFKGDYMYKNSVDYVILASAFVPSRKIGEAYLKNAFFTDKKLSTPVTVAGYEVLVQDLNDPSESPMVLFILDPSTSDEVLERLGDQSEALNQQANKTNVFKDFNGFVDSFFSTRKYVKNGKEKVKKGIDYGYAHTIHKSQGATYTNIFVDLASVSNMSDIEQKNQMTYVSLSRATNIAFARVNEGEAQSLPVEIDWNDSFSKKFTIPIGKTGYKYPTDIATYSKIRIMEDPATGIRTFSYSLEQEKLKYQEDGKTVVKTRSVPAKGILTEETMRQFINDYPNALVLFNDYDGKGNPIGSNSIWRVLGANAAGITTKLGPAPTKVGSDKHNKVAAMTDETLDDNKRLIDESIKAIEAQLNAPGEPKFLVIDEYGFGQYMIGFVENEPTVQKPQLPVIAKQTFLYLSEQLYRKFGYVNPHFLSFKEGRVMVQKGNVITDEDIIEQRKCQFKSK